MFNKGGREASVFERWGKLLSREQTPEVESSPEFVSAEELAPWSSEPAEFSTAPTGKPLPEVRRVRSEGPIARYGSEIRSALGPGTLIEGKFAFDSPVRIDGTLRGEVHSSSLLVVGEEGSIDGLVCVGNLVVYGRLKGHIVADEVIQITSSGEIVGEIENGQLAIELGGKFEGTVKHR